MRNRARHPRCKTAGLKGYWACVPQPQPRSALERQRNLLIGRFLSARRYVSSPNIGIERKNRCRRNKHPPSPAETTPVRRIP